MIPWPTALDGDRRAVSETLGYILVFSIVVMTITTATVFGFGGLENRQAAEQVTNVERAFDVMADNFQDIRRYEDHSRATEIRLAGGTIGAGDPVTITVGQWNETSQQLDGETRDVTFRPLVFRSDGGEVAYESGVVFRGSGSDSAARSSLPFVVSEDTALVPVTATSIRSSTTAVGGDRTALIVGERPSRTRLANQTIRDENGETLAVQIDSPRAAGWERQLDAEGYEILNSTDQSVTAELDVEKVRLPVTNINIRFN